MVATERKRILLSELDDHVTFDLIRLLYEHNRTHDVLLARTPEVTRTLLQSERFSVVALRAHPSKPNALSELCARVGNAAQTRFVVVSDADADAAAGPLYTAGADRIVPASTSVASLAGEIFAASRSEPLLTGRLEQLQPADLIQCMCLSRRSVVIRIAATSVKAVVWLDRGEIHHAVSGTLKGLSAISAILHASSGEFWATSGPIPERSVQLDWQHALIEAARLGDEESEWPDTPPDQTGTRLTPVRKLNGPRRLGKTYRELNELGLECMKAGDFAKAQEYWSAARQLGDQDDQATEPPLQRAEPRSGSTLPAPLTNERGHT
jgi:DNA-binding NarL/FixJ family response regulator